MIFIHLILFLFSSLVINAIKNSDIGHCDANRKGECEHKNMETKFLYYDVNLSEGFNLRRDVYMRFAIMLTTAHKRGEKLDWTLILPPWYNLYHWKANTGRRLFPWSLYFDIKSMKQYARVVELHELYDRTAPKVLRLDRVYVLQNFENPFENGHFVEKWAINKDSDCQHNMSWGYQKIEAKEIICVRFQGRISQLWDILALHPDDKNVMIAHGEIPLHDNYGTKEYWDCRKSMQFNEHFVYIASVYLREHLHCDFQCNNYVSVHWRRQDFALSRYKEVPSAKSSAIQIDKMVKEFDSALKNVYVATDAPTSELNELISHLSALNYKVFHFIPDAEELSAYSDGGIAVVEQIICSRSAFFIGTHESTFTYRIQEEREILGYPSDTTFNRLCPDSGFCEKPSRWTIVN